MNRVEIVLHVRRIRRTLKGLLTLAAVLTAAFLALRIPAVRVRVEHAADGLAGVFVPTPPATVEVMLPVTPTPAATPTPTPRPMPTPRPTPTFKPAPTPRPTPTPPPTPAPTVVGTPRARIEVRGRDIVVTAIVPPVRRVWYAYDVTRRRWEREVQVLADPVDPDTLVLVALPGNVKAVPPTPDLDLRTLPYRLSRVYENQTEVLRVVVEDAPLAPGYTYEIRFSARTRGTPWTEPRKITASLLYSVEGKP